MGTLVNTRGKSPKTISAVTTLLKSGVANIEKAQQISINDLLRLGYQFSGKRVLLGGSPHVYALAEMLDEDSKKPAAFCYLYSIKKQSGVVLKENIHYYVDKLQVILKEKK